MSCAVPSHLTSQGDKNYLHPANLPFPHLYIIHVTMNNMKFTQKGKTKPASSSSSEFMIEITVNQGTNF